MTDTPKLALSVAPFSDHVPRICDWNGEVLCCMGVNESELVSHYQDKAAHIINCVNMHDGLVAFAEAYLRAVTNQENMVFGNIDYVAMAKDALAQNAEVPG